MTSISAYVETSDPYASRRMNQSKSKSFVRCSATINGKSRTSKDRLDRASPVVVVGGGGDFTDITWIDVKFSSL